LAFGKNMTPKFKAINVRPIELRALENNRLDEN
jgi:hypothetical protein